MSIRVCVPFSTRTVQSTTQSPTAPCPHRRRSNSCWKAGPTSTSETAYVNNTLCHLLFDKDMFRCYQRQRMWTIPYVIFYLTKTCSGVIRDSVCEQICHLLFDKDMFRCYQRQRMWTIPYVIFIFYLTKICSTFILYKTLGDILIIVASSTEVHVILAFLLVCFTEPYKGYLENLLQLHKKCMDKNKIV